ncbi:hypothetical protein EV659_10859 [Rhodothalassium salexigens DSM 2132]|uniref:Uncharacterized protein n=1 Tax=Rhodothalassium salexigens DSM 2132 TaxID=1188247 RepID=A0A4R2PCQ7_RHOSA|nr:hypothetical protein [Rhodothalassium salexigens]MBB4212085.1 hypothetical protein [Rhodothalassium salexigens DSM 2132]TCP32960.1 hypothetical protein EV659_10859 [Rhodothalassium salexigens DSM 2132]
MPPISRLPSTPVRISPSLALVAALGVLGAVAGLVAGSLDRSGEARGDRLGRDWADLPRPAARAAAAAGLDPVTLTGRLIASDKFGDAEALAATLADRAGIEDDARAAAAAAAGAAERPTFPPVVAAALVDDRPTVYLAHPDGRILGWWQGQEPVPGWHILHITLDAIRVRYQQGEPETRPVFRRAVPPGARAAAPTGQNAGNAPDNDG